MKNKNNSKKAIQKDDVMWWENPNDDTKEVRTCMVQVKEIKEGSYISVKQLYNEMIVEVRKEELYNPDLLWPEKAF
jgi:hypothetical protein